MDLVEALRRWTERSPIVNHVKSDKPTHGRAFNTTTSNRPCVYCTSTAHKSGDCTVVTSVRDRKQIISTKKLCFNCICPSHRASQCKSRGCFKCNGRHHTSICNKDDQGTAHVDPALSSTGDKRVIYPTVVVRVNGVKCRALLDTGAGSCYASSALIERLRIKPIRRERKEIEMLMHTTTRKIDVFNVEVTSNDGEFKLPVEVSKVEKEVLLNLNNPHYEQMIQNFNHLNPLGILTRRRSTPDFPSA